MANHSGIADSGEVFQIIPTTRKIVVPPSHKVIGVVGDINSEEITFKCPRLIDGHDIANCTKHSIEWESAGGTAGKTELNNIRLDGDYVYFKWTISGDITKESGFVGIAVLFEDIEAGKTVYKWGTTTNRECTVLDSGKKVTSGDGKTISIYSNGEYNVTEYTKANVQVASGNVSMNLGELTADENRTYRAADRNLDGFSEVTVDVPKNVGTKTVNQNTTYKAADDGLDGYSEVTVNVTPKLQNRTVTPSKSTQIITKTESDAYGLGTVTVNSIPTDYIKPTGSKDITVNGNNISVKDKEYVNVNVTPLLEDRTTSVKAVTPTKSAQTIEVTNKDTYYGLSKVKVNPIPDNYVIPSGTKPITANGDNIDVKNYEKVNVNVDLNLQEDRAITANGVFTAEAGYNGMASVNVNVHSEAPRLQEKTLGLTAVPQEITPDDDYNGLSKVTINKLPDGYIKPSGTLYITKNTTTTLESTNGKAFVSVNVQPNVGTISTITQNNTYNASAYNLDGFKSVTVNVTPKLDTDTVTPSEETQIITPDNGFDGLSSVTVNPIPTEYVIPTGSKDITANGEHNVAGLATVNVNVTAKEEIDQDITPDFSQGKDKTYNAPSGKVYSSVTLKYPADLKPENIRKGVTIFGIEGTFEGYHGKEGVVYIGVVRKTVDNLSESDIKGFNSYEMANMLAVSFTPTVKGYIYFCLPEDKHIKFIAYQATPEENRLDKEVYYKKQIAVDGQTYNVYCTSGLSRNDGYEYKYNITIE